MIFLKKGLGAVCTLGLLCVLSRPALAQSVLNFAGRNVSRIAVTNTTPYIADVKFTLYTRDGSQAATALNPVSRRVPPKGQISVAPSDFFRMEGARTDTWIQASSPVTGLEGIQFSPDFNSAGGDAFDAYPVQTIPYIPLDLRTPSTLYLTNPGSQTANFTLTFFTREGIQLSSSPSSLPAHAQLVVTTPPRAVSARVRADTAIIAVAAGTSGNTPVLVRGRSARAQARVLVAPYFKDKDNNAQLILTNSNNADAEATVTFFTDGGAYAVPPIRVSLKANGTASVPGPPEGWVLVESPGAPISGIVLVASGNTQAAIPLQVAPSERMLFSRSPGSTTEPTFNLIGTREPAIVTVTLNRPDGTTIAKRDFTISPLHRFSEKLSDIISVSDSSSIGYLTVQSTAPVYGLEVTNGDNGSILSGTSPQELGQGFQSSAAVSAPRITGIDGLPPGPDGVKRIAIAGQNFDDSATLSIGGRVVPMIATATNGRFTAELPELEPGFVNVKVRVGGLESKVFALLVAPENGEFFLRSGRAMYQKTEVLESGLDPNRTAAVPIRGARVEVWDPFTQRPVSVSETDEDGAFRLVVPDRPGLRVRVQSRLRSSEVRVLDNPVGGQLYALTADAGDARDTAELEMMDTTRQAGAFNILDNVQRANTLLALSDPQMPPPPLTIYWNERNAGGAIKATFFNPDTNTAHVLGDRNTDSDEFDDSVILHEYAHMLAARFSRDESPGGPHFIGDILDPRLAWSEGWANFFSCAARGTPIYLDSKGPGVLPFRYDLEDDIPPNDRPGYYSEASVGGLLWDLLDESQDNVDSARFSFAAIWAAFVDLRNVRYVYLPYFLESFLEKNPGFSDALRAMVIRRGGINFQPDARPSVVEPFPRPIAVGVSGAELDSYSYKRTNLMFSTHYYSFSTATGGTATITLTIETLGAANNPNANDLDLYLYDANGKRLDFAARVGNGQPETIAGARLSPGTYYIEVRSYYLRPDNTIVFNSGRYRLGLQLR